ncbi:unknown protein [Seminavis robusta]|uniref:Circumsporozoite protein n=1 Tax=Seminavis robusta TaxID=568900 RepID=A0A9N8HLR8_9STRA|nr:unknown protein [Seminavis robusta]|eukprot:Sro939_g222380.1 n/a (258) ;mRNA; f:4180-5033
MTSQAPTKPCSSTTTSDVCTLTVSGGQLDICFDSLLPATSDVTIQTSARGDLNSNIEFYDVLNQDGDTLGQNNGGPAQCSASYEQADFVVPQALFNAWVATGFVSFIMDASADVSASLAGCFGQNDAYINLVYQDTTPSTTPSFQPSMNPSLSVQPSEVPSALPSLEPSTSIMPSFNPSLSIKPSALPSSLPSVQPSEVPSLTPSREPSALPSLSPSRSPSLLPSVSLAPSNFPSMVPSLSAQPSAYQASHPAGSLL